MGVKYLAHHNIQVNHFSVMKYIDQSFFQIFQTQVDDKE
jgi:hypothetical protein